MVVEEQIHPCTLEEMGAPEEKVAKVVAKAVRQELILEEREVRVLRLLTLPPPPLLADPLESFCNA
jgi:hypothetical protein